ncbi:MAG: hypothetical protein ACPHIZ_00725 [Acidimicrobiales bacterium]
MTSEQHRELFETVKNWDRWGADDEAGALNLITPELRAVAAAEVTHGHAVSCARELPVEPNAENRHPALHMMVRGGDDCVSPNLNMESTGDFVGVAFHGMATSHIDALATYSWTGKCITATRQTPSKAQALLTAASWSRLKELLAGECFSTFPVYEALNG